VIDIAQALSEISRLELEKAKLEVLTKQLEERKDQLAQRMAQLGVTTVTIMQEIDRLEISIRRRIDEANGRARAEATRAAAPTEGRAVEANSVDALLENF